jgi:Hemerythrin HHE cation binding domain
MTQELQVPRDDFFTLIHKGQRRELFLATTQAGTLDWDDPDAAAEFGASWSDVSRMLTMHAKHEDNHFLPLLIESAPELVERVHNAHRDSARELVELTATIDAAALTSTSPAGIAVYRELSTFVASYLGHILEEETVVMPAIWDHCTDDEIANARRAFLADQSPAGLVRSRRAILPAISRHERATMARTLRASTPPEGFDAFMADAQGLLEPKDWAHLSADVSTPTQP